MPIVLGLENGLKVLRGDRPCSGVVLSEGQASTDLAAEIAIHPVAYAGGWSRNARRTGSSRPLTRASGKRWSIRASSAHGCVGIFDACMELKMEALGNRVFACGADRGQDGHQRLLRDIARVCSRPLLSNHASGVPAAGLRPGSMRNITKFKSLGDLAIRCGRAIAYTIGTMAPGSATPAQGGGSGSARCPKPCIPDLR